MQVNIKAIFNHFNNLGGLCNEEQSQIKIANSLEDYFLHLCKYTEENGTLEEAPRITSVEYSNDLLSLMQKWKNKETSNKER